MQLIDNIFDLLFVNLTASGSGNFTAFATGGQVGATVLNKNYSNVNICASNHDSVKAETALAGMTRFVKNSTVNICDFYPAVGDIFDFGGLLINQPIELGSGESVAYYCVVNGTWQIK
jgi:hypothetical protein